MLHFVSKSPLNQPKVNNVSAPGSLQTSENSSHFLDGRDLVDVVAVVERTVLQRQAQVLQVGRQGINVVITNIGDFCQLWWEKIGSFS
jgi:hypothetical protein